MAREKESKSRKNKIGAITIYSERFLGAVDQQARCRNGLGGAEAGMLEQTL